MHGWLLGLLLLVPPTVAVAGDDLGPLRALWVQRGAETVALGSLLDDGAPTVVSLWASYCVACRGESSTLVTARKAWGTKIILVLADVDNRTAAEKFRRETGTAFELLPVAPAQDDAIDDVAPEGFPANFLIAGNRVVRIDRLLKPGDLATFFGKR
jgi:thiol-disulfide isomerase/thioredoxin